MGEVQLRDIAPDDLPIFFEQQRDTEANYMAAFTSKNPEDRSAFDAHWQKILTNDAIIKQTILHNEKVAGHVLQFEQFGEPEVSYWIGKDFWGKGIATRALNIFLEQVAIHPLFARAAKDNIGSIRVLQKCGFKIVGEDKGFANARGAEIEEYILKRN